ncbi:ScbA/BarX family gamma-butyrolactone biosynthesis protein [Micromonospora sp. WMMC241]|uniref:ScbA/BarX family gamma-butyrolactone biosynthesis protein n=1 Tax=Micromonospora sp. WMMC241 TaxID=3015159 RepID=UPI0022B609CE|nr:ScbA/BarX family gamma-butyrolactone biosynthesis protein [Micromonospora sp. WMMC241]MCZ7440049.1 ScbA/BarX family gamma-butyrolactone biosynthesis protein [Micromonospora sp. WMMC241]
MSYESTVPRRLVHRAAVSEVLLTSWHRTGDDSFVCGAQWPAGHRLYAPAGNSFDTLVIIETVRQAGILVSHEGYGIPRHNPFIMQRLRWRREAALLRGSDSPFNSAVTVRIADARVRPGGTAAIRFEFEVHRGRRCLATATGWARCVTPATYQRLRWGDRTPGSMRPRPLEAAEPAAVGRADPRDVVVAPPDGGHGAELRVPADHPVFFDHPLDHVPGMMIYEAMRQAASLAAKRPLSMVGGTADFTYFIDIDQPCHVTTTFKTGGEALEAAVQFTQNGRVAADGSVTLAER